MLGSRTGAGEEWESYGRRVEAHLAHIEAEIGTLRDVLRAAGIDVRRQRTRIQPENERARDALVYLKERAPQVASPSMVAHAVGVTPEYAYDLLQALCAAAKAERTGRGRYKAAE